MDKQEKREKEEQGKKPFTPLYKCGWGRKIFFRSR